MPAAAIPANEQLRLAALHSYGLLDETCDDLLQDIVRLAARLTDSPVALVSLIDEQRQVFAARHGVELRETPREQAFCAHAILQPDRPLAVRDALEDVRFADNPLVLGAPGIRAYLGVPLVTPEGHPLGTLCVIDTTPRDHDAAAVSTMQTLARTVVTTFEMRRAMSRMRSMALTDPLTGLPNRTAFLEALSRAISTHRRGGPGFSLLFVDLDGFKALNDTLGHAEGDRALAEVAAVLRGNLRRGDMPARLAGDEFAALLFGGNGQEVGSAAERLRIALAQAMEGRGWAVTASIGGITFHAPPRDESEALSAADQLMYLAKRAGRNRVMMSEHPPHVMPGRDGTRWAAAGD